MTFDIITSISQIFVLLIFKKYIIYLLIQSVCTILENIVINKYIDKQYPYLNDKKKLNQLINLN